MNTTVRCLCFCLSAIYTLSCAAQQEANGGVEGKDSKMSEIEFLPMTTTAGDEKQPAALYVPAGYTADKDWPLIVFLHGMGERGDDGVRQTQVGIGKAIKEHPDRFPALVFMPQCSSSYTWVHDKAIEHIDDGIAQVIEKYSVDENKLALTGLSMGSFGSYRLVQQYPERFSGVMAICGGATPSWGPELAKTPWWIFHGGADPVVPPERSHVMVEAIKDAGGEVQYTEYEGVGHNSWDRAYGDEKAIAWLLDQQVKP